MVARNAVPCDDPRFRTPRGKTMDYAVGCELQYTTTQPTTLILNIEVQEANRQEVLREQFTVTPFVPSQVACGARDDQPATAA